MGLASRYLVLLSRDLGRLRESGGRSAGRNPPDGEAPRPKDAVSPPLAVPVQTQPYGVAWHRELVVGAPAPLSAPAPTAVPPAVNGRLRPLRAVDPVTVDPVTVEPVTVEPVTVDPVTIAPATVDIVAVDAVTVGPPTGDAVTVGAVPVDTATEPRAGLHFRAVGRKGREPGARIESHDRTGADAVPSATGSSTTTPSDSTLRHMFRRDFLYVFGGILPLALSALVLPALTRLMGPTQFGIISFATAIYAVFQVLLSLGLATGIQREYSRPDGENRSLHLLASATVIICSLTVVLALTVPYWSGWIGASDFPWAMRLAAIWSGSGAVALVFLGSLRSRDRIRGYLAVVFVQSIGAQALGLVLVLAVHRTAHMYLDGVVLGQVLGALLGMALTPPKLAGLVQVRMLSGVLAFSVPLIAQQLAVFVLWSGDRIVVQRDIGSVPQARYAVAYAIGAITINFISQLNLAWIPRVFAITDRAARRALILQVQRRLAGLLYPAVLGVSLIVPYLLEVASPPSYHPAGLVVVTLLVVPASLPYSAALSNMRTLLANGQSLLLAGVTATCALLNLVLNVLLVPSHGITGSAAATLVSYAVLGWLAAYVVGRDEDRIPLHLRTELGQWAVVGVCLATALIPVHGVGLAVRGVALVAAGVVGVMAVRRVGQDEPVPVT